MAKIGDLYCMADSSAYLLITGLGILRYVDNKAVFIPAAGAEALPGDVSAVYVYDFTYGLQLYGLYETKEWRRCD